MILHSDCGEWTPNFGRVAEIEQTNMAAMTNSSGEYEDKNKEIPLAMALTISLTCHQEIPPWDSSMNPPGDPSLDPSLGRKRRLFIAINEILGDLRSPMKPLNGRFSMEALSHLFSSKGKQSTLLDHCSLLQWRWTPKGVHVYHSSLDNLVDNV